MEHIPVSTYAKLFILYDITGVTLRSCDFYRFFFTPNSQLH